MRYSLLCIATLIAITFAVTPANAQTLIYSFETGTPASPDGFFGVGATVAQDTIGATNGPHSLKSTVAAGTGFSGSRTLTIPAGLDPTNDAITAVELDLTINTGEVFTGAFANVGVTLFGHVDPDGIPGNGDEQFGHQFQVVAASERNVALAPGTYHLNIPLFGTNSFDGGPKTFANTFGDDPGQFFAISAFQLFWSKSGDAPLTTYVDNVTLVVPEPASVFGAGAALGLMLVRRRRH